MHRPTGYAVLLAKHFGSSWTPSEIASKQLTAFFKRLEDEQMGIAFQEDLCVAMECCNAEGNVIYCDWTMCEDVDTANGIYRLYRKQAMLPKKNEIHGG